MWLNKYIFIIKVLLKFDIYFKIIIFHLSWEVFFTKSFNNSWFKFVDAMDDFKLESNTNVMISTFQWW